MVTNYERGRNFEYRVRDFFRDLGYFVVRSSGSHGVADLVCLRSSRYSLGCDVVLVQCKYGEGYMSKKELEEFDRLCMGLYANGYVAVTDGNGHIRFRLICDIDGVEAEILERQVEE